MLRLGDKIAPARIHMPHTLLCSAATPAAWYSFMRAKGSSRSGIVIATNASTDLTNVAVFAVWLPRTNRRAFHASCSSSEGEQGSGVRWTSSYTSQSLFCREIVQMRGARIPAASLPPLLPLPTNAIGSTRAHAPQCRTR